MDQLKIELDKLEKAKVVCKVQEPTEFVSSLVIVKKPKGLRICIDPQHLNTCILREYYKMPTFEEISAKMKGAKVFSTLDASSAFYQVKLTDDSSVYTTFNTPYGRYCYLKLPYGLCSAPEVFNRCFAEIFGHIENVGIYVDDLVIWSDNMKQHIETLSKVLAVAERANVKFNLEKCKFCINEIIYLGHKFSERGIEPDENKVKAILEMKPPTNGKQLQTFLGMLTYI
jgi:hypothetical protein